MTGIHESIPEGTLMAEIDQDGNGSNYLGVRSSIGGLNDNKWHHVVVVGQGSYLKLYVDGKISAEIASNSTSKTNISNNNDFKLGRSLVGVADKFAPKASFDDVRIYKGVLTDTDIQYMYNDRK
jgi:hypothetical protein